MRFLPRTCCVVLSWFVLHFDKAKGEMMVCNIFESEFRQI